MVCPCMSECVCVRACVRVVCVQSSPFRDLCRAHTGGPEVSPTSQRTLSHARRRWLSETEDGLTSVCLKEKGGGGMQTAPSAVLKSASGPQPLCPSGLPLLSQLQKEGSDPTRRHPSCAEHIVATSRLRYVQ